jgi:hypothetical protein
MAADQAGGFHIVWPTLVSNSPPAKGVFYADSADGTTFSPRVRLDAGAGSASHPAIALGRAGTVLAVWDVTGAPDKRVEMRIRTGSTWTAPEVLTHTVSASSPAVAAIPQGFLVAWGGRDERASAIELRRVR